MADDEEERLPDRRGESFLRLIFENIDQYAFGIITQHGYQELEDKLTKHAEGIEKKLHGWLVKGLAIVGFIALCTAIALVGFGVVLSKQSDTQQSFKDTRKAFVRDSCVAQNKRHDKTIKKLDKLYNPAFKRAKTVKRQKKLSQSRQGTIGLIDALAPKQDCEKLALVSVGEATPPPPDVHTERSP
jgi:hypothetical protein